MYSESGGLTDSRCNFVTLATDILTKLLDRSMHSKQKIFDITEAIYSDFPMI